jgi:hypothetical protein
MHTSLVIIALYLGTIIAGLATAQAGELPRIEPVDQIMQTYRARHALPDLEETLTVTLVERPSGKKETTQRKLMRYGTVTDDGARRVLLRFLEPPDVAGGALLTVEQPADTAQWTSAPGTHAVTAIPPAGRTRRFLGTTFTYEDLEPENLSRYRYTVTASETFHGSYHWAIAAVPVPEYVGRTAYSKRLVWIRQKDYALVRIHYYSKDGTLVKIRKDLDFDAVGDQAVLARTQQMRDIQGRRKTVMTVDKRVRDAGLDESLFTPEGFGTH